VNRTAVRHYQEAKKVMGAALMTVKPGAYALTDVLAATEPLIGVYATAALDWFMNTGQGVVTVVWRRPTSSQQPPYEVLLLLQPEVFARMGFDRSDWPHPPLPLSPIDAPVASPVMRELISDVFDSGFEGDLVPPEVLREFAERRLAG